MNVYLQPKVWRLRAVKRGGPGIGENTYTTEVAFIAALRDAWRGFAAEISATLPDGTVLDDAELRNLFPA